MHMAAAGSSEETGVKWIKTAGGKPWGKRCLVIHSFVFISVAVRRSMGELS
jgi:hypothetical protein